MTARLLATRSLTEASGPSWTTILRSCGAYEAYLRTYRGVPSRAQRRRVPAARPAVPALASCYSVARAERVPARHRAAHRPRRGDRPRAAAARADPQRPRVPADRARSSTTCPRTCTAVQDRDERGERGHPPAVLPDERRAELDRRDDREAPADHALDRLPLRRRGHRVVQRGPDAAGQRRTASWCCTRTSRSQPVVVAPPVHRLLGHAGARVRRAHAAPGADAHGDAASSRCWTAPLARRRR